MTAQQKLDMIGEALAAGKTVYLSTPLRVTVLDKLTADKFVAAGLPFLKVSASGSLRMAYGRGYVCADYVSINIQEN